jgi:hypothetical protein
MVRDFARDAAGAQIMRSNIKIKAGGAAVESGFSDHYGLVVRLSKRDS